MASPDRSQRALQVVIDAAQTLDAWLDEADLDPTAPTPLPCWDVAALVVHCGFALRTGAEALRTASRARLTTTAQYVAAYGPIAAQVAERERQRVAELNSWAAVRADYTSAADELARLAAAALPERVAGLRGVLRTPDYLATRAVELIVHGDDLARSLADDSTTARGPAFARPAVTMAVRALTGALGDNHPGHTIEVRIPPHAAVQCGIPGDGPTHTRGTPPNVVETDATTFLRLSTGRLTWADAVAAHQVNASGTRADLSALLPLW